MSTRIIMVLLCLFGFLSVPLAGIASEVQINDNLRITSGHLLYFQDGTSQGTAGYVADGAVTTDKLASKAVTADKIADGTITATQLQAGTITATQIQSNSITAAQLATDSVGSSEIATSAVNTGKIAARSVTPDKIAFYTKVAIVSASGGDYTNPATAMSAYASWCGTPAADNPCLVKIMPGVYDIGTSYINMHAYIDIEGSGENVTRIKGNNSVSNAGVVNGASNAELRFLTLEQTGGAADAVAIFNSSAAVKITNVTVIASGGTGHNYGIYNYDPSTPSMQILSNVTVKVTGSGLSLNYGVYNTTSSPLMTNMAITVSGGNQTWGIYNSPASVALTNTRINASGGTLYNVAIFYDSSLSSEIRDVTMNVSGGSWSIGVWTSSSTILMANDRINVSGGSDQTIGVYSAGSSSIKINHSIIKSSATTVGVDSGGAAYIGASQLDGGAVTGSVTCAGVYNENFVLSASPVCP